MKKYLITYKTSLTPQVIGIAIVAAQNEEAAENLLYNEGNSKAQKYVIQSTKELHIECDSGILFDCSKAYSVAYINSVNLYSDNILTTLESLLTDSLLKYVLGNYPAEGFNYKELDYSKDIIPQFDQPNTIYGIYQNIDLEGNNLPLPEKSILFFKGGAISNGTLEGNDSTIAAEKTQIFDNVTITGEWKVAHIFSEWFKWIKDYNNTPTFHSMMALSSDNYDNHVIISEGDYYYGAFKDTSVVTTDASQFTPVNKRGIILCTSNTRVTLNGHLISLKVSPFGALGSHNYDLACMSTILIIDKENVIVDGCGTITGDLKLHADENIDSAAASGTYQWRYGVSIRHSKNVKVEGITCEYMVGDGFCIGGPDTDWATGYFNKEHKGMTLPPMCEKYIGLEPSENITLIHCRAEYNKRQGLSIEGIKNGLIDSCVFNNTGRYTVDSKYAGTPPMYGIDIEPAGQETTNLTIVNTICNNNRRQGIGCVYFDWATHQNVEPNRYAVDHNLFNVTIDRCSSDGGLLLSSAYNVTAKNSSFKYLSASDVSDNLVIQNCNFDYLANTTGTPVEVKQFLSYQYVDLINNTFNKPLVDNSSVKYSIRKPANQYLKITIPLFIGRFLIKDRSFTNDDTDSAFYNAQIIEYTFARSNSENNIHAYKRSHTYSSNASQLVSFTTCNRAMTYSQPLVDLEAKTITIYGKQTSTNKWTRCNLELDFEVDYGITYHSINNIPEITIKTVSETEEIQNLDYKITTLVPISTSNYNQSSIANIFNLYPGLLIYDTTLKKYVLYNGTEWTDMNGNSLTPS